jgi:predicted transcriptional regulator
MKLSELAETLDASFLSGEEQSDIEIVKAGASDLMSDILAALSEGGVLLTGLTTNQAVKTAIISGSSVIVFVRNKEPDSEIIALARMHGIPLLSTPCSMFVSCGRLYAKGLTGLSGSR